VIINKEQLLTVPELKLEGKPAISSPVQIELYVKQLNAFIDSFPTTAEKMQDATDNMNFPAINQLVSGVCATLAKIHADDISREYRTKFDRIINSSPKDETAIEALVENLILAVSSLSVDIQMASKRKTASSTAQNQFSGGSRNILVVDNAVMFLNTVKRLLEDQPYDLKCVTSGNEALEYIKNNRPDAFLLDIEMPGMDGYELARRIRGSGHNAPIIFITANSAREYVDKASQAGGVAMLMKPVRINQLLAKLREHL
jgi:CheY-like chemotaxis protein